VQNLEIVCHATIHEKTQDMHRLLNIGPKPNITIYGTVARNKKRYSSDFVNPNPAQLLCDSITTVLNKNNIELKNKTFKKSQLADTLLLVDYQSPSLQDIVISLLDRSDNMFTEAVLRAIAVGAGKEATANNGIDEVHALWKSKGIDTTPLFQRDGSGLARNGRASARFFTQMLRQVNADSTIINVKFPSLMTKLGVNAHIGKKIKDSAMKGKIASKSGSMSDVQCYVGYFPADNPKYTWACLVNNWQGARAHLKDEIEVLLLNLFAGLNSTETPVEQ
jgi:D-alanyl-D-alanine carboxypeptidase/D-alanyl-D-alanine-endopeptidase (penicillin-binding protein 4)